MTAPPSARRHWNTSKKSHHKAHVHSSKVPLIFLRPCLKAFSINQSINQSIIYSNQARAHKTGDRQQSMKKRTTLEKNSPKALKNSCASCCSLVKNRDRGRNFFTFLWQDIPCGSWNSLPKNVDFSTLTSFRHSTQSVDLLSLIHIWRCRRRG